MKKYMRKIKDQKTLRVLMTLMLGISLVPLRAMEGELVERLGQTLEREAGMAERAAFERAEQAAAERAATLERIIVDTPRPTPPQPVKLSTPKVGALKPKDMTEIESTMRQRTRAQMYERTKSAPIQEELNQSTQELNKAQEAKIAAQENLKKLRQEANKATRYAAKNPAKFQEAFDAAAAAEEKAAKADLAKAQASKKVAHQKLVTAQKNLETLEGASEPDQDAIAAATRKVQAAEHEVVIARQTVVKDSRAMKEVFDEKLSRATIAEKEAARGRNIGSKYKYEYDPEKHATATTARIAAQDEANAASAQLKAAEVAQ